MTFTKTGSSREIERKFLLKRLPDGLTDHPHEEIAQGYLAVERGGVQVRLRKKGNVRSLTYKRGSKTAREEREVRLSAEQFESARRADRRVEHGGTRLSSRKSNSTTKNPARIRAAGLARRGRHRQVALQ